jgi:putative protease
VNDLNIVARLKSNQEIKHLVDLGTDVFLLDITDLTTKAINPLTQDELLHTHKLINKQGKQTYILMNKMIHETDLLVLRSWLSLIKDLNLGGVVINDFTIYVEAKKQDLDGLIIYQPGTMNTNSYDVTYLEGKIKGMTLSKEITFEEIQNMVKGEHRIEFSLVAHGYLDMFYSKRKLISNYLIHKGIEGIDVKNNQYFTLEEKTRQDIHYPILEDYIGTHIFHDKKLESFDQVKILSQKLSDIFIERLFVDDKEYYDSIKAYHDLENAKAFLDTYGQSYHKGFYFTPTERKKGEKHEN